jgi:CobQ-like glutamine amidotransferase family enzyme
MAAKTLGNAKGFLNHDGSTTQRSMTEEHGRKDATTLRNVKGFLNHDGTTTQRSTTEEHGRKDAKGHEEEK